MQAAVVQAASQMAAERVREANEHLAIEIVRQLGKALRRR